MDEEFIEVVNYFQKYAIGTLEPREVYKWYSDFLPKGKRYNKYIKSKNKKKYDPELINILCDYFEDSKSNIIEYINFMNKKQLKEILKMHGRDK
jgi:N-glycosylase/DNA lyase